MKSLTHQWASENYKEFTKALRVRDAAMRKANLQQLIREEGMEKATEVYDQVMADNPVPEPSSSIRCLNGCGDPYDEEHRMAPCSGSFMSAS